MYLEDLENGGGGLGGGGLTVLMHCFPLFIMCESPNTGGGPTGTSGFTPVYPIPFTDWKSNAHSMTVQRGQNAHYVPSL